MPRELEHGRQRHPLSVARVQTAAGDRLADRSRHPARARARSSPTSRRSPAMSSRCSSRSSKAARSIAACSPRTCRPTNTTIWTSSSACSSGTPTSTRSSPQHNRVFPIPAAADRARDRAAGIPRAVGVLRDGLVLGEGADRAAGRTVTITDSAAYGIILTQGLARFGTLRVSTPAMIRFGDMTEDELFVTADAAQKGVRIENLSDSDPLVHPEALRSGQSRRRAAARADCEETIMTTRLDRYHNGRPSTTRCGRGWSARGPTPSRRSISTRCSISRPARRRTA